jgi:monovalent cation/hydrogen antiporter
LGEVAFVLAMVAVIIVARLVADRLKLPDSIVLTICGLIYAGLPGPDVHLEPHLILLLVIPPLVYAAARRASLLAIRANWRPIASLSIVLVLLTTFAVGGLVSLIVPSVSLAAAVVLGAAVAPTDPVAALSVGSRAGLPPRMVALIGGESMLNDATALTTWQVAVAATVGSGFSLAYGAGKFVLAAAGGLVIGAAIGYVLRLGRHLLRDPLVANTASLATPFLAYIAGEEAHVSGVLAVVIAGLMAGHDPPSGESGASRLQTGAVWQLVEFLLEGFVFLLIGEQLPRVLAGLSDEPAGRTAGAIIATLGAVLVIRPLWLILTQILPGRFGWRLGGRAAPLNGREVTALTWAGTRGVITLATVFAIPTVVNGRPFPDRDLMLLCAYVVVLVTLLGQGLTFAPLLRKLGLQVNAAEEIQTRNEARLAALAAASAAVDDMEASAELPEPTAAGLRDAIRQRTDRLMARISLLEEADGDVSWNPELDVAIRAQHAVIAAQRAELVRWRDCGRLPDESLRILQHELDLQEGTLPGRP